MKKIIKFATAFVLLVTVSFGTGCSTESIEPTPENFLSTSKSFDVHKTKYNFTTKLSGESEVPSVETDARGQAIVRISQDGTEIYYRLTVTRLVDVRMAHFHLAPEGANGPVVAFLYNSPVEGTTNGVLAEGTITADDLVGPFAGMDLEVLANAIKDGQIYINVHTGNVPSGELRGQL